MEEGPARLSREWRDSRLRDRGSGGKEGAAIRNGRDAALLDSVHGKEEEVDAHGEG